eukprot:TRINITY_DN9543_c0_g1_i12.p1 TRINITY_DN9543_c0_g1~~TRINITY_DN9543_c0_g1_i12.p1  ORF type:complete len:112 (-),score=16.40 TRINITY_DN9543_c0_g1_i12:151-465(-)
MIRRPPRSTHCISSAASDVYKRQINSSVPKIVKWFSVYLAVFFLFNLYNMFFPVSYVNIIRRVALYKLPFISMSIVFLHQWILMYLQSTDDIEVKKYLKEFKRR